MPKLWLQNGKLVTCGGKLAYQDDCPCDEGNNCNCPIFLGQPVDYPCWPCNGLYYEYIVSYTLTVRQYTDDSCSVLDYETSGNYSLNLEANGWMVSNCRWQGITASGYWVDCGPLPTNITIEYDPTTNKYFILFSSYPYGCAAPLSLGGSLPSGTYPDIASGCLTRWTGTETRSYEFIYSNISVVAGVNPTVPEFICTVDSTSYDKWFMGGMVQYPDLASFCNDFPGETARHVVFGTQEFWTMPAWGLMWNYSETAVDYSAYGFGYEGGNADIIVMTAYCTYVKQCPVPVPDLDELQACP